MTTAIALHQVTKHFVDRQPAALRGVDLDVLRGTCTALLGPSGSGKSTILRIVAGLETPSGGEVLIDGRTITHLPPEKRHVGLVFQRPLLFPHLSVIDNVAFAARAAGTGRSRARDAALPYLEMVHLADLADRSVTSLSGGQEQRVALARALAAQPAILLLDEPFTALDTELRHEMHELLAEIRHRLAPTILLVTHDRDEATRVADRIAVLDTGRLLQHDTVDRVYHRPASTAVARLMGAQNLITGNVIGGVHHSDLGAFTVDDGTPDGPGALHIRHESIGLTAGAVRRASPDQLVGDIAAITRTGLHRRATVRVRDHEIEVDVPAAVELSEGETVTLQLPPEFRSVVRESDHGADVPRPQG